MHCVTSEDWTGPYIRISRHLLRCASLLFFFLLLLAQVDSLFSPSSVSEPVVYTYVQAAAQIGSIPGHSGRNNNKQVTETTSSLSLSFVYCPQSSCHPHNQKLRVYCQPNKQGALASTIYSGHVRANAVFEVNSGSCAATVDPRFPISSAVAPPRSQFPFDLWVAFHYV